MGHMAFFVIKARGCACVEGCANMDYMRGIIKKDTMELPELRAAADRSEVRLNGAVHTIRDIGDIVFIILRKRDGIVQCVYNAADRNPEMENVREASTVEARGIKMLSDKAPNGFEVKLTDIRILSEPSEPLPIPVGKWKMGCSLETMIDLRPVSLRNLRERAKFKIQEGVVRGFRDCLMDNGFTEIHSPKLGAKSAEGGANLFRLEYFHRPAILQQSPQFYKQMMVGVFDRVFEVAPVFRAEKHNTTRHLNEYTSLDFEMGYIDSFYDIMGMETSCLQRIVKILSENYQNEIQMLGMTLPDTEKIPCVRFDEAKRLVSEKYSRPVRNPYDLEPEEEVLIGRYFKEECGADFVFVTHYPTKKRPFYAMPDPVDDTFTLSFDCLYHGLEITTGGQRIHDYDMLMKNIEKKGMTPEGMDAYLSAFKAGMPPHGGLGIGLERLTMKLCGEDNVRETTLFPRDMSRLEP